MPRYGAGPSERYVPKMGHLSRCRRRLVPGGTAPAATVRNNVITRQTGRRPAAKTGHGWKKMEEDERAALTRAPLRTSVRGLVFAPCQRHKHHLLLSSFIRGLSLFLFESATLIESVGRQRLLLLLPIAALRPPAAAARATRPGARDPPRCGAASWRCACGRCPPRLWSAPSRRRFPCCAVRAR